MEVVQAANFQEDEFQTVNFPVALILKSAICNPIEFQIQTLNLNLNVRKLKRFAKFKCSFYSFD